MTQHNDFVSLRHMYDHAREAVALAHGRARQDLDSDRVLALALVRLVEIVGEAATRISAQFRSQHPQIPWNATIGLRNRLIHGYDSINHDILWQILTTDFPPLVVTLERIVGSE